MTPEWWPDIHPMALALGALGAFALTGIALQCLWLFALQPVFRWLGRL